MKLAIEVGLKEEFEDGKLISSKWYIWKNRSELYSQLMLLNQAEMQELKKILNDKIK